MARSSGARSSTTTDGGPSGGRLALLLVRAVQVGGPDLTVAEQLQPLLEDVLELLLRPPLEEHVPVRPGRLLSLRLGLDPGDAERLGTTPRALPDGGDVGLDRHRDLELVPLRAPVTDLLASGELDAALVLEPLAPEPRSTQCALCHEPPPDLVFPRVLSETDSAGVHDMVLTPAPTPHPGTCRTQFVDVSTASTVRAPRRFRESWARPVSQQVLRSPGGSG